MRFCHIGIVCLPPTIFNFCPVSLLHAKYISQMQMHGLKEIEGKNTRIDTAKWLIETDD